MWYIVKIAAILKFNAVTIREPLKCGLWFSTQQLHLGDQSMKRNERNRKITNLLHQVKQKLNQYRNTIAMYLFHEWVVIETHWMFAEKIAIMRNLQGSLYTGFVTFFTYPWFSTSNSIRLLWCYNIICIFAIWQTINNVVRLVCYCWFQAAITTDKNIQ